MKLDLNKIENIEIEGVDHSDYPAYCDAFIVSADLNGVEMTDEQLDSLADNYPDFVYDAILKSIF